MYIINRRGDDVDRHGDFMKKEKEMILELKPERQKKSAMPKAQRRACQAKWMVNTRPVVQESPVVSEEEQMCG